MENADHPFNYTSDATPEKINVIFSSADYFGDRDAIGAGNSLTIDNVELIYNSQLTSLTYDGKPVEGFAMDNYGRDRYEWHRLRPHETGLHVERGRRHRHKEVRRHRLAHPNCFGQRRQHQSGQRAHLPKFSLPNPSSRRSAWAGEPIADFDPSVSDITLPFPYDRSLVFDFSTSVGMYNGDFTTDDATETATLAIESGDRQGNYTLHFTDAVADAPLNGNLWRLASLSSFKAQTPRWPTHPSTSP